jgi:exosome complex exonuclease DIS3/RRP44
MQEAMIVTPFDRRLPRARLRTRRAAELAGQRFVVRLDAWPPDSQYPAAHLVGVLGALGDLQ